MYLLDGEQMKAVDSYSIGTIGIPSLVLMERAALAVTARIRECAQRKDISILCVCGSGNNGADGMAAARLLIQAGFHTEVLCVGGMEKEGTAEAEVQKNILHNMGAVFRNNVRFDEYDFIVDAIFGIGLSRAVTGVYAEVIEQINAAAEEKPEMKIVSVDIPSGIHAGSGQIMAHAIRAHETVTFGFLKLGQVLYPGAGYAGKVTVAEIGFIQKVQPENTVYTYSEEDLYRIPVRAADTNKGTCGKVLIAAGSKNMGGAACLSAQAAYRAGCGLVRVFTHENNRFPLLSRVPEAILQTFDGQPETVQESLRQLSESCKWADCIVLGPGLSTGTMAAKIVRTVLESGSTAKLITDADALNLIAADRALWQQLKAYTGGLKGGGAIVTPHMGEMSRLVGKDIKTIKQAPLEYAAKLAKELSCVCVLKDAATVVTDGVRTFVNTSGNCGMSTAGAGDVLTGVMAGMATAGFTSLQEAAAMAVYVHGLAGDKCREQYGVYGMKASDIAEAVPKVLSGQNKR